MNFIPGGPVRPSLPGNPSSPGVPGWPRDPFRPSRPFNPGSPGRPLCPSPPVSQHHVHVLWFSQTEHQYCSHWLAFLVSNMPSQQYQSTEGMKSHAVICHPERFLEAGPLLATVHCRVIVKWLCCVMCNCVTVWLPLWAVPPVHYHVKCHSLSH